MDDPTVPGGLPYELEMYVPIYWRMLVECGMGAADVDELEVWQTAVYLGYGDLPAAFRMTVLGRPASDR